MWCLNVGLPLEIFISAVNLINLFTSTGIMITNLRSSIILNTKFFHHITRPYSWAFYELLTRSHDDEVISKMYVNRLVVRKYLFSLWLQQFQGLFLHSFFIILWVLFCQSNNFHFMRIFQCIITVLKPTIHSSLHYRPNHFTFLG